MPEILAAGYRVRCMAREAGQRASRGSARSRWPKPTSLTGFPAAGTGQGGRGVLPDPLAGLRPCVQGDRPRSGGNVRHPGSSARFRLHQCGTPGDDARVVDERVEPVMGGAEPAGEGADCIDVLQIGQAVADARAAGRCRDRVPGTLRPAMIAGQEMDRRPRLASATAAARPIPDVAPVMTTVRPSAEGWSSTVNSGSRADRTGRPVRRNPGPRRPLVRRPPPARSGHGAPPRRRPAGPNRCARWRRGPRTRRAPRQSLGHARRPRALPRRKPGRGTGASTWSVPRSRISVS